MNNPEYILVDVMRDITASIKTSLDLPNLNYQYGKLEEINEMLIAYTKTTEFAAQKFPMIWVFTGFKITRGNVRFFGETSDLRIFIITGSAQADKSVNRIEKNFKPLLYPIYREFLRQIAKSQVFTDYLPDTITHSVKDYYFFSQDGAKSVLTDAVDCVEISNLKLTIKNNNNCPKPGATY